MKTKFDTGYKRKIRVLIVDDHPVVLEGMISLLSSVSRILVVGTAKTGEECLKMADSLKPDVVLLDLHLPDICGVELLEKLKTINPQGQIIMLSGENPEEYVNSSIIRGARGFLLKDCSPREMTDAVARVFKGEIYFSQSLTPILKSLDISEIHEEELCTMVTKQRCDSLTHRETEIMELVAKGLHNKEIAASLGIKRRTVDYHIGNILSKLGADSRIDAILIWKGLK